MPQRKKKKWEEGEADWRRAASTAATNITNPKNISQRPVFLFF
jgi:hypothetical protein